MIAIHIAASFFAWYAIISVSEYSVHRFAMHRMRLAKLLGLEVMRNMVVNHMAIHHKRDYHHHTHDKDDRLRDMQACGLIPVGIALVVSWSVSPLMFYVGFVMSMVYAAVWWVVHLEMHRQEGKWFSRTALFRYLEWRHQFHHVYPNTNFNVVVPFADWLFGTMPTAVQKQAMASRLAAGKMH